MSTTGNTVPPAPGQPPAAPPPPPAPTPSQAIASLETDASTLLKAHMGDLKNILTTFVDETAARAGAAASTWVPKTKQALDDWIAKL